MGLVFALLFLGAISYLIGNLWGRYDAFEIEKLHQWVNHTSRLALRCGASAVLAGIPAALLFTWSWWLLLLLLSLFLYCLAALHIAFVPTLNSWRNKLNPNRNLPKFYISDSNWYDSQYIGLFGKDVGGKVAYLVVWLVLLGAIASVFALYRWFY